MPCLEFWNPPKYHQEFIDREQIIHYTMGEVNKSLTSQYFNVINIHGFGGLGKTSLLHELKIKINKKYPNVKIIDVSFEMSDKTVISDLCKIRKQLNFFCPHFDYAFLKYWDRNGYTELKGTIFTTIEQRFFENFSSVVSNMPGIDKCKNLSKFGIPYVSELLKCFDFITNSLSKLKYKEFIQYISNLEDKALLPELPKYLGEDIYNNMSGSSTIFLFDAYVQSMPYSRSSEWLLDLIKCAGTGLYVVTSREKLLWEDPKVNIQNKNLEVFPNEVAEKYLSKYIEDKELIDAIIKFTGCIPIYVDLALDVYSTNSNNKELLKEAMFKDRNELVKTFIDHLNEGVREAILSLSIVRIFNEMIFDQLVHDLSLKISNLNYKEVINTSLINYTTQSTNLTKIHDVFCNNVDTLVSFDNKIKILKAYTDVISTRCMYDKDKETSVEDITVLFNTILALEIKLSKDGKISTSIIENTITIFLELTGVCLNFSVPEVTEEIKDDTVSDMLYFFNGFIERRNSTKKSIRLLESVKFPEKFGKHESSYNITYHYNLSLTGKYSKLKEFLFKENKALKEKDKGTWYYIKLKSYIADYDTMDGKFIRAMNTLNEMNEYVKEDIVYKINDKIHWYRYIGHIYRFNMMQEDAVENYSAILKESYCTNSQRAHLNTNICESLCYTDPVEVIKLFNENVNYIKEFKQTKDLGKIYYSKAIAETLLKNYEEAQENINTSIKINSDDGYDSGCLFAYMAQACLDYAKEGFVSSSTLKNITELINNNGVYKFFMLPIAIMQGDQYKISEIEKSFEWLDFKDTLTRYNNFLSKLKS